MTPAALSQQIADFIAERTEALVARFLPDFTFPGFFCGYRKHKSSGDADLISLLARLHALGVSKIAGMPIDQAMTRLLRGIDGPGTDTFYSFFIAEALLEFGPFENNPLLADLTPAERENIAMAVDSTQVYDPKTRSLGFYANNYWGVLARCEYARQRLGLLRDDALLRESMARLESLLFGNPLGYLDDDQLGSGRYDIYSADIQLFCEPLWPFFDAAKLDANLRRHVHLLETIAMENGASYVFGRSIGAMSLCVTIEMAAMSLSLGLAANPARTLGLAAHAFAAFKNWFEDDLINAHRHGMTEAYRGTFRVLQMTVDCLGKFAYAAVKLREVAPFTATSFGSLFPPRDEFIPLDEKTAGVWMFRNKHLTFQLPLTGGSNADYVPWPRSPGLFENPVESQLFCGVPRLAKGAREFTVAGLPAQVEKNAGAISFTHENFRCVPGPGGEPLRGRRTVTYRVEGDTIFGDEVLSFDEIPDAVSLHFPETARPLRVVVKSETPFRHDTLAVGGMADWRSCWSQLQNVHQIHFTPAREIRFSYEITPKLRLRMIPAREQDYSGALFSGLPAGYLAEFPCPAGVGMNAAAMTDGIDLLHVHWPEHLFGNPVKEVEKFDAQNFAFIAALGRSPTRIVWTMHNRRPHHWDSARGRELYRAWARIADGVIHHSAWGMKLMRAELPFRDDARHVLIPHGHFGAMMPVRHTRAAMEADLGLAPCAMRFGLLGRWQKEKQVETIIAAFLKAARPDQQLVVTAYSAEMPKPDDPRVVFLPRKEWMSRDEIAANTRLCDALISAHTGDTYLTSGISADAVGVGIPMLAPNWEFFHETLGDAAFYHDNTVESLAALFASLTPADLERGKQANRALQAKYAWPRLGEKTLELYRSLGRKPERVDA